MPNYECPQCGYVTVGGGFRADGAMGSFAAQPCPDCGNRRGWSIKPHCPVGALAVGGEEEL